MNKNPLFLHRCAPFSNLVLFTRTTTFTKAFFTSGEGGKINHKSLVPLTLNSYLNELQKILIDNAHDLHKAQLLIENKWVEIYSNHFNTLSRVYKDNNNIFSNALETLNLYIHKGFASKAFIDIKPFLNNEKIVLITFSYILSYYNIAGKTSISAMIGRNIAFYIYKNHFRKEEGVDYLPNTVKFDSFNSFMESFKMDTVYFIKLGSVLIELFTTELNPVFSTDFSEGKYTLSINKEYENKLHENVIILSAALPMVCKPLTWSHFTYGGFLLNRDIDFKESLITGSHYHDHKMKLNQKVYDIVNYINSLQFSVNTDLLNYLDNEGCFLLDYYKDNDYPNYINNMITLDVARTYKNTTFYLNINLDWRGRIYTKSYYLDYQGSEFSLAFININKAESLTEEGKYYFYIYGANIFNEDNISKKPFEDRYNWVINNLNNIYSMHENFILKAESPTLFAAFCLNMKHLKEDSSYLINFPVFLDATCSGVQHFAAMLLDKRLAESVNLIDSQDENVVKDFYNTVIPGINKALNNAWKKDSKAIKFVDIKLDRKILKRIIMTKAYNVTTYGINEQLKSCLEKIKKTILIKKDNGHVRLKDVVDYRVPTTTSEGFIQLDTLEIEKMGDIISENIFKNYDSLYDVYKYLKNMAKITIKLNLPITWSTPTGLELTQNYNLSKIQKVTVNILGKNKTAVWKKWTKEKDTRAEVQAIIPNIIHSMDASHLMEVIYKWSKKYEYILTIHDCFGCHPNDMLNLSTLVREEFINLYSNKDFLKNIHEKFTRNLLDYKVPVLEKNGKMCAVIINKHKRKEYLELPILPKFGDLDISQLNGKYFIS